MRTVRIKVCKFPELKPEAKKIAIEDWRNSQFFEFFWAQEAYDTLEKFCERFNITYRGASFNVYASTDTNTNDIDDNILELSGVRLRTWIINNHYDLLYSRKHYGELKKNGVGKWKYKRYSRCQWEQTDCPLTGYGMDIDIIEPLRVFIESSPSPDTNWEDLLSDCLDAWVKSARSDCEDQLSDSYISDHLTANEYEFTIDGKWH